MAEISSILSRNNIKYVSLVDGRIWGVLLGHIKSNIPAFTREQKQKNTKGKIDFGNFSAKSPDR
jgi:hypothetical protein